MDGKWDILTRFHPLWNVSFMKPFSRFLAFLATASALFYALLPNWVKRRVFLLHWVHNGANKRTEKDQRVVKLRFSWLTFWTRHFYFTFIITTFAVGKSNYISVLVYEAIDCLLSSLMWCQRAEKMIWCHLAESQNIWKANQSYCNNNSAILECIYVF